MNTRSLVAGCGLSLLLLGVMWSQDTSAVSVQTSCAHWAKVRIDKHKQFKGDSNDLYQTGVCLGYFEGLMDGMDNTGGWLLEDKSSAVFQIKRSSINSTWNVIQGFYTYLDANPLANGKPAWSVLQHVLMANRLAAFVPQTQYSALSSECKTGTTNILTEFNTDADLKTIDTPTLASATDKLIVCGSTPGITDSDIASVLTAAAESQGVLVSRAVRVLERNSLLQDFKAERLRSTTQI